MLLLANLEQMKFFDIANDWYLRSLGHWFAKTYKGQLGYNLLQRE